MKKCFTESFRTDYLQSVDLSNRSIGIGRLTLDNLKIHSNDPSNAIAFILHFTIQNKMKKLEKGNNIFTNTILF